jgi:hypothetical protein
MFIRRLEAGAASELAWTEPELQQDSVKIQAMPNTQRPHR